MSLRFFRDNPGHVAMRLRGWWLERDKLDRERRRACGGSEYTGAAKAFAWAAEDVDDPLGDDDPDEPDLVCLRCLHQAYAPERNK
jgi:hypothetical protein